MRETLTLRPYQEACRQWALDRPYCALWLPMGLGKTPTTAMVMIDAMIDRADVSRWLVVGPKLVATDTWPRAFDRWAQLDGWQYRVITAADLELRAGWDVDTGARLGLSWLTREKKAAIKRRLQSYTEPITMVSWDMLPWLVKAWGASWPYDGLVLDEAVFAASSTSERSKAVYHVAHRLGRVRRMIQLTGAPTPNGYEGLHGQALLLDGGERLGRYITDFRAGFMEPARLDRRTGRVWDWKLRRGAKEQIDEAMAPLAASLRAEDYVTLPPLTINPLRVELPPEARRVYAELEAQALALVGDSEVLAPSAGVLVNKLLQVASGAVYDDRKRAQVVHDAKLDALAELLEAAAGPVLLAYGYDSDWLRIKKRFRFAKHAHDKNALNEFRGGAVRLLCMHPASGGHGVDGLQNVASEAVWFGATYNADHWAQFNARLHRDGQRAGRVVVHQLLARDTLEEYVAGSVVPEKLSEQDNLLKALMMRV